MSLSERNNESGHALVELSLVAFVLFIIAFWSVEISRVLRYQQVATALSRELASVVYRECAADNAAFPIPRTDAPVSRFDPRTCIPGVLANEFLPQLNRIAPGAVVSVSYYGYDGTNVTRDFISDPNGITRFDPGAVAADVANLPAARSDFGNALVDLGVVVIGEIQLPHSNLGVGAGMFATHFTNWLYGVTIL